jgi:small-conductance mechanosensitive channel
VTGRKVRNAAVETPRALLYNAGVDGDGHRIFQGFRQMSEQSAITTTGAVKLKPWVHAALLVAFAALSAAAYWMDKNGMRLGWVSEPTSVSKGTSVAAFLYIMFLVAIGYEVVALAIQFLVRYRNGSPGEVIMLSGLIRVVMVLVIVFILIRATGELSKVGAVAAIFGGSMLGWALQSPVSGVAAWALVAIKRPFRIGDRVLFPMLGLTGDVLDVGFMYTRLNQVGGSIGSEESIGRSILIPNAMLFSQVAINYTPKQLAPYFLDEVIIRLTFDSDWDIAEKILLAAARNVTGAIIRETGKEPYIRSDIYDYGVYMRLRYMTPAWERPRVAHEILKQIFREFQRNPRVDFAIPYVYSYRKSIESGAHAIGPEAVTEIPMEAIDDPEANAPLRPADPNYIAELAERIKQMGLLQPVLVERTPNGRYALVAGRFRLLACERLGWKAIPAIVKEADAGARGPQPQSPK